MKGIGPILLLVGGLLLFVLYRKRTMASTATARPAGAPPAAPARAMGAALAGIPPAASAAVGATLSTAAGFALGVIPSVGKSAISTGRSIVHTVSFGLF